MIYVHIYIVHREREASKTFGCNPNPLQICWLPSRTWNTSEYHWLPVVPNGRLSTVQGLGASRGTALGTALGCAGRSGVDGDSRQIFCVESL